MKNLSILLFVFISVSGCQSDKNISKLDVPALLDRSLKLQYSNEWPEVKNHYADLKYKLVKDNENIEALIHLSQLFINEARITGAHGHYYNAALKMTAWALSCKTISRDQRFLCLSNKASIQLSLHDFRNAYNTAREAVSLNPYNASVYGALVDACVELGQYAEAVQYADKMVSIRPDIRSYSRVSYLREIHGMPDEAIAALKLAVEAGSPGSEEKSWAALQLAKLDHRYGRTEEAKVILKDILAERENYPFAKEALAEINIEEKNYVEAEKELKEACDIIPEVSFYIALARLYKMQGRDSDMNDNISTVIQMLQDDTDQGHNMSLEYSEVFLSYFNDPERALVYLQNDLQMRPDNIDINRMLAKIYAAKKDKLNVENCLKKAKMTNSKHPELSEIGKLLSSL
ncbi:MAG: hypothetical protein U0V49_14085 [Saprospiraceae bacterium]